MPHSYGADLALLGRRGARMREATKLNAPKMMASTISINTGRYWLTTSRSLHRAVRGDDRIATMHHPTQHEEHDRGADGDDGRVLAQVALVSDHLHVLRRDVRIDLWRARRATR